MKIIQCHIENFGQLHQQSFDFTDGRNVICESNGWGKSTLAAFIKVMFFGFSNEKKRDDYENERKHYKPWQGGVYGGQITFEAKGKKYVLSRTFGEKDKDDVFVLRDAGTNMESKDYSVKIGEELFQIDGESFERTIYISQNDCETVTTDSINAKIGNLAENTDDINNFDTVNTKLSDLLNKMSPRRKTGSLHKEKEEIATLERDVQLAVTVDRSIDELEAMMAQQAEKQANLKERQQVLMEQQKKVSAYKDIQAKKEQYQRVCEEYSKREEAVTECEKAFSGAIPEKDSLKVNLEKARALSAKEKALELYQLKPEEELKLQDYKTMFQQGVPAEEDINRVLSSWNDAMQKKNVMGSKKATASMLEQMNKQVAAESPKKEKNGFALMFWIGLVVILLGVIVVWLLGEPLFAGILLATAVIISAVGYVVNVRKKPEEVEMAPQEENPEYVRLLQEIQQEEAFISKVEADTKVFFAQYHIAFEDTFVAERLYGLKTDGKQYKEYLNKQANYEKELQVYQQESLLVTQYLESLSMTPQTDRYQQLSMLSDQLQAYEMCKKEFLRAKEQKETFIQANPDYESFENIKPSEEVSLQELDGELSEILRQLEEIAKNQLSYDRQIESAREQREEIAEKEGRLQELKEQYDKNLQKYHYIEKTKELMEQAKISFTSKYMAPIMNGFEKYYKILADVEATEYRIDANANLTIEKEGLQREIRFLSAGYRDLIGVCMRMALVDAMYQEEKPFVIFDDPFVNLDEDKVEGGIRLLDAVAKEYQCVYFTCHNSRV